MAPLPTMGHMPLGFVVCPAERCEMKSLDITASCGQSLPLAALSASLCQLHPSPTPHQQYPPRACPPPRTAVPQAVSKRERYVVFLHVHMVPLETHTSGLNHHHITMWYAATAPMRCCSGDMKCSWRNFDSHPSCGLRRPTCAPTWKTPLRPRERTPLLVPPYHHPNTSPHRPMCLSLPLPPTRQVC